MNAEKYPDVIGLDLVRVKDLQVLEADGFSAIIDGDEKTVKVHFEG